MLIFVSFFVMLTVRIITLLFISRKNNWKRSVRCWNKIKSVWRKRLKNFPKQPRKRRWEFAKKNLTFINKIKSVLFRPSPVTRTCFETYFYQFRKPYESCFPSSRLSVRVILNFPFVCSSNNFRHPSRLWVGLLYRSTFRPVLFVKCWRIRSTIVLSEIH